MEEVFLLALLFKEEEKRQRKKQARFWILERFLEYFCMSSGKYNELLEIIHEDIQLQNIRFRHCILPVERLAVCLRSSMSVRYIVPMLISRAQFCKLSTGPGQMTSSLTLLTQRRSKPEPQKLITFGLS
ncbi:uncharacterized protein LOC108916301 [Anoplophora glabripennis]|uniref:uncharacterized protein LOC108916301 n=1 Tax=Anoplophora glabripennis TaxID=217634 RepID=UPI0008747E5F|nr:uncharacterized protein LOC108916301 [Anoplophora glabripennis]